MISFFHKYVRAGVMYIKKKLTERQFLLFACIIVGATASLAAVTLKLLVFRLEELFFSHTAPGHVLWYQILLPVAGMGISALLITRFFKKDFLKGNDKIVYAIAKDGANLPGSQVYSHIVTSSITVGLGGSAGLESPMVATGAAIGSNFGRLYYLPYKEKTVLLACGIASGIASAFSAPIAGVLFALEVLMIDITITTFIPLIISAATGALIARIILGDEILLSFRNLHAFNYNNTLFYVVIGIFCGLSALYYTRMFTWLEHQFAKMRTAVHRWVWGSLLLVVLIFFFPPLFGEGYHTIKLLADNNSIHNNSSFLLNHFSSDWALLLFLVAVILFKVFATAFTLQGGGNGGSFAPALFIGGVLGFVAAKIFMMMGYHEIPAANFVVAGMAGMLSGVFFAPLTAIFLSAEITGGYSLILPLMLVSAISFFVVKSFEPLSMEMKKLSANSRLNPSDRDKFLLSRLELTHMVGTDYLQFQLNTTLPQIAKLISRDLKDVYAVVGDHNKLQGVIYLNDIKSLMLDDLARNTNTRAADLMIRQRFLSVNDDVETALYAFEQHNTSTLAVVTEDGEWAGFITKAAILDRYRQEILRVSYN
jgi:CIC family chloride channel protein